MKMKMYLIKSKRKNSQKWESHFTRYSTRKSAEKALADLRRYNLLDGRREYKIDVEGNQNDQT